MRSRGLQFTPKRLGEFNALNVNYREQGNALIKRRLPAICWDDSLRRAYRTGRKVLRRVLKLIYGCSRMPLNAFLRHRWAFAEWLQSVPEEESRQLRNMLLFLLFPDIFERIFGGTDRYQIASHFSKKPKTAINHMTQIMIDRELQMIRSELEEQYQTKDLDFYVPPLTALWKGSAFKRNTSGLNRDHVLRALQEIDNNGIPPDAKATTYDLIHGANRYPPKYVLSLACKYASGHNQLRAHSQTSSPRITSPGDSRLFMASPSTNSSANSGKMNLTDLLSTLSIKCRD